ncbi:MAG: hypothetical protein AAGJ46_20780 [Planctomycetota bacterium]
MAKRPGKHGGKREGAGRPKAPAGERRDKVFSIKLTVDEKALLDDTEARKWARDVLLKSARLRAR